MSAAMKTSDALYLRRRIVNGAALLIA